MGLKFGPERTGTAREDMDKEAGEGGNLGSRKGEREGGREEGGQ